MQNSSMTYTVHILPKKDKHQLKHIYIYIYIIYIYIYISCPDVHVISYVQNGRMCRIYIIPVDLVFHVIVYRHYVTQIPQHIPI